MKRFPEGIYFNHPHEKAPKFVIGKLSVHRQKFLDWLNGEDPNEKGYINFGIINGKQGKPYIEVDTWQPNQNKEEPVKGVDGIEVPF